MLAKSILGPCRARALCNIFGSQAGQNKPCTQNCCMNLWLLPKPSPPLCQSFLNIYGHPDVEKHSKAIKDEINHLKNSILKNLYKCLQNQKRYSMYCFLTFHLHWRPFERPKTGHYWTSIFYLKLNVVPDVRYLCTVVGLIVFMYSLLFTVLQYSDTNKTKVFLFKKENVSYGTQNQHRTKTWEVNSTKWQWLLDVRKCQAVKVHWKC